MRIAAIDILRALTMVLMIWVNDFWTLTDIPKWLTHASASEDYMGFSDVIFPLFLFIVGLSIPHAIQNRLAKNETRLTITKHILIRGVALLLIGVFMVNWESAHDESIAIGKDLWCVFMALAVVLIWTNWKRSPISKKYHIFLQLFGVGILIYLAIVYKGGESGENWMTPKWWGILGLIGWAYLVNALAYLFSKGNLIIMSLVWLLLVVFCVVDHSGMSISLNGFARYFSVVTSGTVPAFTAAGIIATLGFKKIAEKNIKWGYLFLTFSGITGIALGLLTRPNWGISKIQGTPSWLGICTGIGFLLFVILYYIADTKKKTNWAKIIAPAGTATLSCYMIPYFIYPIRSITTLRFPDILNSGVVGLIVSLGFALLVVVFTGWLEKKGYKLKL
ncbi:MAG: heparan-alpha-glucosaminide N-acetyltransferase domain-containing protein [Cellulophaga sp.]